MMAGSNDIKWSAKVYELRDLIRECKFPVVVQVERGYYANNELESLASQQILRIHRIQRQPRVIGVDKRGRHFSLPVRYRFSRFDVVKNGKKDTESKFLWEIIEKNTLPTDVYFSSQNDLVISLQYVDNAVRLDVDFGKLTLKTLYDEIYLQGNAINNDNLDKTIINIPMYSKISVAVGEGFYGDDGKSSQWHLFRKMLDDMVLQKVDFKQSPGNLQISLFSERSVHTVELHHYEELEPSGTLTVRSRPNSQKTIVDIHEESPPKLPERPPSHSLSLRKNRQMSLPIMNSTKIQKQVDVGVALSPTKVEEMRIGVYDLHSVQPVRPTLKKSVTFSAATAAAHGITPVNFSDNSPEKSLERRQKDVGDRQVKFRAQTLRGFPRAVENDYESHLRLDASGALHSVNIPPPDYDMDTIDRRMITKCTDNYKEVKVDSVGESDQIQKKIYDDADGYGYLVPSEILQPPETQHSDEIQSEQPATHSSLLSELSAVQLKPSKNLKPTETQKADENPKEERSATYSSLISELAAVQLKRSRAKAASGTHSPTETNSSAMSNTSKDTSPNPSPDRNLDSNQNNNTIPDFPSIPRKYKSTSELPTRLDGLTVDDVCDCLILLNLENYIGNFRSHMIDGEVLVSMGIMMMKTGLKMTDSDAKKLKMFAEGWRP